MAWRGLSRGLVVGLLIGLLAGFAGGYFYKSYSALEPLAGTAPSEEVITLELSEIATSTAIPENIKELVLALSRPSSVNTKELERLFKNRPVGFFDSGAGLLPRLVTRAYAQERPFPFDCDRFLRDWGNLIDLNGDDLLEFKKDPCVLEVEMTWRLKADAFRKAKDDGTVAIYLELELVKGKFVFFDPDDRGADGRCKKKTLVFSLAEAEETGLLIFYIYDENTGELERVGLPIGLPLPSGEEIEIPERFKDYTVYVSTCRRTHRYTYKVDDEEAARKKCCPEPTQRGNEGSPGT